VKIEIRNNELTIRGYINAVERDSRQMQSPQGLFVEQVKAGTWTRSLSSGNDINLLLNHDNNRKLGSISQGNMILKEDNIGLHAEVRVVDAEVVAKAKKNQLVGWSFGFNANKDTWTKREDGINRRFLEDINLVEVSILDDTRTPAYVGTSIESREDKEVMFEQRFLKEDIDLVDHSEIKKTNAAEEQRELDLIAIEIEL